MSKKYLNRKLSLVGIYPRNIDNAHYDPSGNSGFEVEASGLQYIVSAISKKHKVTIPYYKNGVGIGGLVKKIIFEEPDILLFSLDTYMLPTAQKIIQKVKEKKDVLVIGGGSHFVMGQIEDSFDYVIRGEGEQTIKELLESITSHTKKLEDINGLSYMQDGEVYKNPPRARNTDLDSLALPFRTKELAKNKSPGSLLLPALKNQKGFASITASRGCFYNCSFCTNESQWGRNVIYRTVDNVMYELEHLRDKYGTNIVFFNDLNITSNKKWLDELCEKKIEFDKEGKLYWYAMSNIATAQNQKMLNKMKKAGCTQLMFGIETINPVKLQKESNGYERKYQRLEKINKVLNMSQEAGILNHGLLMLGLVDDSNESIRKTIPQINNLNLHSIRISINTTFVGTKDYSNYIITDDNLKNHDTSHLVFSHNNLTEDECQKLQSELYGRFYGSIQYKNRMTQFLLKNPEAKQAFSSFIESNIITKYYMKILEQKII